MKKLKRQIVDAIHKLENDKLLCFIASLLGINHK